jgi:hypothetical protein
MLKLENAINLETRNIRGHFSGTTTNIIMTTRIVSKISREKRTEDSF